MNELTDAELDLIEQRSAAATSGPWFVRHLDDVYAMSLVAVSSVPDTGLNERFPDFDNTEIVAATLIQEPRYVNPRECWDENAAFIAAAREDVPRLVAEVRRLRTIVEVGG